MKIAVNLLPVFIFLAVLVFLDGYKLVRMRRILATIASGCLIALLCYFINTAFLNLTGFDGTLFRRYVSPVLEESLKAVYVVYLIKRSRVGFMVDAAIYGFAVGAGFALVENILYLGLSSETNPLFWIVRGLGTAIMHGGATGVFAVIAKERSDRSQLAGIKEVLPGLAIAAAIHSVYNHFLINPVLSTILIIILLPSVAMVVFQKSEKATRNWLGVGMDSDMDLLQIINSGKFSESHIGIYLQSLSMQFSSQVVADMLCLLRINVELSIRAKGILLLKQNGFRVDPDPEIRDKFAEMDYLKKSVGKTGLLALLPFLHSTSRDLWQMNLMEGD